MASAGNFGHRVVVNLPEWEVNQATDRSAQKGLTKVGIQPRQSHAHPESERHSLVVLGAYEKHNRNGIAVNINRDKSIGVI
jgi:hypothetical protein